MTVPVPKFIRNDREFLERAVIDLPYDYDKEWLLEVYLPCKNPILIYNGIYEERIGARDRRFVSYECPYHGIVEQRLDNHFNTPGGCSKCASPGILSEKYFELNPHLVNNPSKLYFVLLYDKVESFLKCGLTQVSIEGRFTALNGIYDYDIIETIDIPLHSCWIEEQNTFKEFSPWKYYPKKHFGGHTECFEEEVISSRVFNKHLKELKDRWY